MPYTGIGWSLGGLEGPQEALGDGAVAVDAEVLGGLGVTERSHPEDHVLQRHRLSRDDRRRAFCCPAPDVETVVADGHGERRGPEADLDERSEVVDGRGVEGILQCQHDGVAAGGDVMRERR